MCKCAWSSFWCVILDLGWGDHIDGQMWFCVYPGLRPYVLRGNTLIGNFAVQNLELVASPASLTGGRYSMFDIAIHD